mmetsp:Transcript_79034/g.124716  ORF Transcript_79034/g.124716 Transcript_79034/m.124716 type:complete len:223 (-) Transcript_79034:144-812(-)
MVAGADVESTLVVFHSVACIARGAKGHAVLGTTGALRLLAVAAGALLVDTLPSARGFVTFRGVTNATSAIGCQCEAPVCVAGLALLGLVNVAGCSRGGSASAAGASALLHDTGIATRRIHGVAGGVVAAGALVHPIGVAAGACGSFTRSLPIQETVALLLFAGHRILREDEARGAALTLLCVVHWALRALGSSACALGTEALFLNAGLAVNIHDIAARHIAA